MKKKDIIACVLWIGLCEGAGILGSLFTSPAIPEWYAGLAKPDFTPPPWVFGPVWTTLFLLMGIAAFFVWRQGAARAEVRFALSVFAGQLALNVLWSVLFFGMRDPGLALAEIVCLWLAIAVTLFLFTRISRIAGWLLAPYLFWVGFAAALNHAIWMLNTGV